MINFSVGVGWIKLVILSANFDPIQSGMVLLCVFFFLVVVCFCLFFFFILRESHFGWPNQSFQENVHRKLKSYYQKQLKNFPYINASNVNLPLFLKKAHLASRDLVL